MTENLKSSPHWSIYIAKYADSTSPRPIGRNFMEVVDYNALGTPLHFYVWILVGHGRVVLVDTGCSEDVCRTRGYAFVRDPVDSLKELGYRADDVTDVIVTHLHWDHAGNLGAFGNARIYINADELGYVASGAMGNRFLSRPFDPLDVRGAIGLLFSGRIVVTGAEHKVCSGLRTIRVGGHTPGLQVAVVETRHGPVVLASDAMHFYANYTERNPFPVLVDVAAYLRAFDVILGAAGDIGHVVAGHDPAVENRFAAVGTSGLLWKV